MKKWQKLCGAIAPAPAILILLVVRMFNPEILNDGVGRIVAVSLCIVIGAGVGLAMRMTTRDD